jgi:hypothetical protein
MLSTNSCHGLFSNDINSLVMKNQDQERCPVMKTAVLFLLLLFPLSVKGQTFWSSVIDREDFSKSLVTGTALFQDSIILITGASCNAHRLFAFNYQGEMLWNTDGYHDLIISEGDHFYTAGVTIIGCVSGEEQLFLTKYDRVGQEVFRIGYSVSTNFRFDFFSPKSIHATPNGDIIVSSVNSVVVFNSTGTTAEEFHIPLATDIGSVYSIKTDKYLISTKEKLYLAGNSFVPDDSVSLYGNIKTIFAKDTIYVLLQSDLIRLDTGLNIIDTLLNSSPGDFQDMNFYEDQLWVQAGDAENVHLIKVRDTAMPDTMSFERLSDIRGFIVSENNYSFIGNSLSGQSCIHNYSNPGRKNFDPSLPDIELVDFNIFGVEKEYQYDHVGGAHLIGHSFNAELTLKNNGGEIINSFAVYSELGGFMWCLDGIFYRKFEGVEILPGQTFTTEFERMRLLLDGKNTICFECLAPNSMLEIVTGNNSLCKDFPTGISGLNLTQLKVYPNPVSDWLTIDFDCSGEKRIELYDMTGRRIFIIEGPLQHTDIDMQEIKPGIYILKILAGKGPVSRKIIKQ